MKNKYYIANWKMNGTNDLVDQYSEYSSKNDISAFTSIILCPPYTLLDYSNQKFNENEFLKIGAQNISNNNNGAHTGDISIELVKPYCQYVIIGHSERRQKGETKFQIIEKLNLCSVNNLIPIVCVGENNFENNINLALETITPEIEYIVRNFKNNNLIIAYEPIWAIGNDNFCDPQRAETISKNIYKIARSINPSIDLTIIYGGSVNDDNSKDYISQPHINGLLIGRASLNAKTFYKIISNTEN